MTSRRPERRWRRAPGHAARRSPEGSERLRMRGLLDAEKRYMGFGGPGTIRPPAKATQCKEGGMRIDVKGRNVAVGDELRERIEKRVDKIPRQVSELSHLPAELQEERHPAAYEGWLPE